VRISSATSAGREASEAEDCYTDTPPAGRGGPRWLTGTITVDDAAADPLLAVLPPMIVVPTAGQDWLAASVRLLVAEVRGPRPGAAVMISRILDLLFVRLLGSPPAAYLAQRRLDHAAEVLRTTRAPGSAVADEVGYTSEAAFSRAFRRRHGMPPLRWRRG